MLCTQTIHIAVLASSITTHGMCKIHDTYGTWRARNLSTLRGHMVNHSCPDSDCFALRPRAIQSSSRSEMAISSHVLYYHSLVIHRKEGLLPFWGMQCQDMSGHCFKFMLSELVLLEKINTNLKHLLDCSFSEWQRQSVDLWTMHSSPNRRSLWQTVIWPENQRGPRCSMKVPS